MKSAQVRTEITIPVSGGEAKFVSFRGLIDDREHIALRFEPCPSDIPLVRIHSECLTGDIFLSGKCDCGEQLREATAKMQQTGGILLYLRQEGRGIGLYNKLDAYKLQQQGLDTYDANRSLGFGEDERNYSVAAQMLLAMGHKRIRLLSNNPEKFRQLRDLGIDIDQEIPTGVFLKESNRGYLLAKVLKSRHRIALC